MFKYQGGKWFWVTTEKVTYQTDILGQEIKHTYFILDETGLLTIFEGYSWNGMTGVPRIFQKTFLYKGVLGTLYHDVLYQAMQLKLLDMKFRKNADLILKASWENSNFEPLFTSIGYFLVSSFGKFFLP